MKFAKLLLIGLGLLTGFGSHVAWGADAGLGTGEYDDLFPGKYDEPALVQEYSQNPQLHLDDPATQDLILKAMQAKWHARYPNVALPSDDDLFMNFVETQGSIADASGKGSLTKDQIRKIVGEAKLPKIDLFAGLTIHPVSQVVPSPVISDEMIENINKALNSNNLVDVETALIRDGLETYENLLKMNLAAKIAVLQDFLKSISVVSETDKTNKDLDIFGRPLSPECAAFELGGSKKKNNVVDVEEVLLRAYGYEGVLNKNFEQKMTDLKLYCGLITAA